jgi:tetratricopeptide (TPR) repeat protein
MSKFPKITLLFAVVTTVFSACSTKKNTWMSRNFHNTTAYYNIYWNGFETYKELLVQIESFGYDNYSHVLRVFEYGSILDTAKTMDKTNRMIEKATKAVQKHSIRVQGVEHVKTMEKAYMLMGIGYFYQHNYSMARTVFNVVSSQFPNSPIRYESLLWSARTYIQEKEYDMASALILQVRNREAILNKQTYRELPAVTADLYIMSGRYNEAIPFLHEAIVRSRTKDFKNRLEFILGQIYQQEDKLKEAYAAYRNVTKRNPKLNLDYNARINMALCYDGAYADRENLAKELKKMLQDTKNEQFFGRIYFVLAEMALRDYHIQDGIEYLKKSVEYSGSNRDQLALSATRLADLFFDDHDYVTAQRYYKNAVSVMTSEHPDFDRVNTRAENLTELVKYLDVVKYEEQMQYLASLPENRRDEEIDRVIEEYKRKLEENVETAPRVLTQTSSQAPQSVWYFYNEQTKAFGANEFVRKWGRRVNEDFWFLQQKPPLSMLRAAEQEETEQVEEEEQRTTDYTPADREYYLVNMPLKTAAKERSDKRLEENKFMLGVNYFDLVEEPALGIKTLEELLVRYPNTGYKLQAYYYLYRMNMVLNNEAGKQKYRNLLLREFPDSEQTKQISDPNHFRNVRDNTARAELLYQYTFEAYENRYYEVVVENVKEAERRYPGNVHMPKFKFLEIMALGSQVGTQATIEGLEQFIKTYPHEKDLQELVRATIGYLEQSLSADQLALVDETRMQQAAQQEADKAQSKEPEHDISMFKIDPAAPHYCLVYLNIPEVNTVWVRTRVQDFVRRSYPQDGLRVSGMDWDEDYYLVYVSVFRTTSIAIGFWEEFRESTYVFGPVPKEHYQTIIISAENFQTLMKQRNKDAYLHFFKTHYDP